MSPEMQKFIRLLESQLGYSEKSGGRTKFGEWYGGNVEFDADYTTAPWCDMYLSWAAQKLGYEDWVGQFAYTVYHARWFQRQDAWGTTPQVGALVFFDWSGSKKVGNIDHVGIVTRVEGTKIHTIEGNIDGGVAKRKQRDTDKVVGYGYPAKIKARLEREAARQQEIVTSDASAGPSRTLGSGPGPATVTTPVRETVTPAKPTQRPAPRDAKPATSSSSAEAEKAPKPPQKAAQRITETARIPNPAGRTGTTGKHAKPAAADTNAATSAPTAADPEASPPVPQVGTPAILAPVLLAAVAILAHTRARRSRLRPALTGEAVAPAHRPSGRRRAPGRRRITPADLTRVERSGPARPEKAPLLYRARHAHLGRTAPAGLAGPRPDAPRLPYQGRRRRGHPVVESSAFVQDAPLRGRRHRRAELGPGATGPTAPTTPASRTVPGPRSAPARPAALAPAQRGDLLVHRGYRGRRRAKVPA